MIAASLGCKEMRLDLPEGATIQQALEYIALPVDRRWTVTSINGVVKSKDATLCDGDLLLVVPVGGGG